MPPRGLRATCRHAHRRALPHPNTDPRACAYANPRRHVNRYTRPGDNAAGYTGRYADGNPDTAHACRVSAAPGPPRGAGVS